MHRRFILMALIILIFNPVLAQNETVSGKSTVGIQTMGRKNCIAITIEENAAFELYRQLLPTNEVLVFPKQSHTPQLERYGKSMSCVSVGESPLPESDYHCRIFINSDGTPCYP